VDWAVHGWTPPTLNVYLRMHWSKRKGLDVTIRTLLAASGELPRYPGQVVVRYTRSYSRIPLDQDNLAGSFKPIGDALQAWRVIENDRMIVLLNTGQERVTRKKNGPRPYFEVMVEPYRAPHPGT
jgi:hypothetical protein